MATTCSNCAYSDWSSWSVCDTFVGPGTQYKTRAPSDPTLCFDTINTQSCQLNPLPTLQPNQAIPTNDMFNAMCDMLCASSVPIPPANRIFQVAEGTFTVPLTDDMLINSGQCTLSNQTWTCGLPVDCSYTAWSDWSQCTADCVPGGSGGTSFRARSIAKMARNGGQACNMDELTQFRACNSSASFLDQTGVNYHSDKGPTWTGSANDAEQTCINDEACNAYVTFGTRGWTYEDLQTISGTSPYSLYIRDCPNMASLDCSLTGWSDVTVCPSTCGPPFSKVQARSIVHQATGNGKPCSDYPLTQDVECTGLQPCTNIPNAPCIYGSWSSTQSSSLTPVSAQAYLQKYAFPPVVYMDSMEAAVQEFWANPYQQQTSVGLEAAIMYQGSTFVPDDLASCMNASTMSPVMRTTISKALGLTTVGYVLGSNSSVGFESFAIGPTLAAPFQVQTLSSTGFVGTPASSVSCASIQDAVVAMNSQPTAQIAQYDASKQYLYMFSDQTLATASAATSQWALISPVLVPVATTFWVDASTDLRTTLTNISTLDQAMGLMCQQSTGATYGIWNSVTSQLVVPKSQGYIRQAYQGTTQTTMSGCVGITLRPNALANYRTQIESATWSVNDNLVAAAQPWGLVIQQKGSMVVPSLCVQDMAMCAWSECDPTCGPDSVRRVGRAALIPSNQCNYADMFMTQKCDASACPIACPTGCNGLVCSGNGTCDAKTGVCQCNDGFSGEYCDAVCPSDDYGNVCSKNGTCDESTNYECVCQDGWTGVDCQIPTQVHLTNLEFMKVFQPGNNTPCRWDSLDRTGYECDACWDTSLAFAPNLAKSSLMPLDLLASMALSTGIETVQSSISVPVNQVGSCKDLGLTNVSTVTFNAPGPFNGIGEEWSTMQTVVYTK